MSRLEVLEREKELLEIEVADRKFKVKVLEELAESYVKSGSTGGLCGHLNCVPCINADNKFKTTLWFEELLRITTGKSPLTHVWPISDGKSREEWLETQIRIHFQLAENLKGRLTYVLRALNHLKGGIGE